MPTSAKDEVEPKMPKINDQENDRKTIRWFLIFKEPPSLSSSRDSLSCLLRDDHVVPDEIMHPLLTNFYYEESGSFTFDFKSRLSHEGPVCKSDNDEFYLKTEETSREASM